MENTAAVKALFMIVNAGFAEDVIDIARAAGIKGATIFNTRGEGAHHESFFGITVDTEKEMIMSVTSADTAERAMAAVKEQAGITTPAHSVCFTLPIEKMVGISMEDI